MFFSIFKILSAAVLIASDSDNLANMDKIAPKTQFFWDPDFNHETMDEQALRNKKVLLVVHGYNNTFESAIDSINKVNRTISYLESKSRLPLYDLVIGYIWPGTDSFIEYEQATQNADKLKKRVRSHILDLSKVTNHIDVMAHSLGNRVMLEALSFDAEHKPLIQNFYSMAPAVNASSIQMHRPLFKACGNIKNLFVMHSDNDDVLKFVYPVASGREALGIEYKPSFKNLSENIQFVDCTEFVKGHSYYFLTDQIYRFIEKCSTHQNPLPPEARRVQLKKDGSVKVLKI